MHAIGVGILSIFGIMVVIALGVLAVIYLIVPAFKGIAWFVRHIFRFVGGMISDTLRFIGAMITSLFYVPLIVGTIVVGRWSAASHYGRALQGELKAGVLSLYRVAVGHPARLLGLGHVVDGIERRVPEVVAAAPGADRPGKRVGQFDGYTIVGSLPGGGSGAKLYVAKPDEAKHAAFRRSGHADVDQVVIKAFSLKDGSQLPEIVREGRALDAAKNLGLVLDDELTNERFYYVTRYVPGQSLGLVTQQMHAKASGGGLDAAQASEALALAADLLGTLEMYHRGGLWHKDVKPDNIIVTGGPGQRAHLVDFGLVTSLRSAMTLTTHGTEYFRDPELVRMALKGVKVHQIDGAKFDVYAAGAVLYSMIENSFPAHGVLSRITRRCPDSVRWIIQRAMTEYDKRYASAAEMLADVQFVQASRDPFAVKPAELPSMRGSQVSFTPSEGRLYPEISSVAPAAAVRHTPRPAPAGQRLSAREQVERARTRAAKARERAQSRLAGRAPVAQFRAGPNWGIGFALLAVAFGVGGIIASYRGSRQHAPLSPAVAAGPGVAVEISSDGVVSRAALREGAAVAGTATNEARGPMIVVQDPAMAVESRARTVAAKLRGAAGAVDRDPRIMIVSDSGLPVPAKLADLATRFASALSAEGVRVFGAPLLGAPGDAAAATLENDLVAQARYARSSLPLDSAEFGPRVQEWLARNAEHTDAIVWISPDPANAHELGSVVCIGPAQSTFSAEDRAELHDAMARLFIGR